MAKAYSANCLVLKHTKLGETDSIVTMLSDEGHQIRAVAKGLRKPGNRIGARLQLFAEARLLLHAGKNLDIVGETKTIDAHVGLRDGLERPACASVIAELLEKLGRDGAQLEGRMYAMSSAALSMMEELPESKAPIIVTAFLFKTLAMQGIAPATRACALCGNECNEPGAFDVSYGGVLCESCITRLGMHTHGKRNMVPWLDAMLYCTFAELSQIDSAPTLELLDLVQQWLGEHLGVYLKSVVFLKSLL